MLWTHSKLNSGKLILMIAIHVETGSYSDRWTGYCKKHDILYRKINCFDSDIIEQCADCNAVLWHIHHADLRARLVAEAIVNALERRGAHVFPNVASSYHYDDKVAQKYLLEAIGAPTVPTWVFVDKADAMRWISSATWPKVFKLRCGAGSSNVRLVRSCAEAIALCRQAFGQGFPAVRGYMTDIRARLNRARTAGAVRMRLLRAPRTLLHILALRRHLPRERGYAYFQEFLPGNDFDTRIAIIGGRAFGFRRMTRANDFRASGSGSLDYAIESIDTGCVQIAFDVARRIGSQSLAFDFLHAQNGDRKIGEISYCYQAAAVHACPGYWDIAGSWCPGHVWPEEAILEDVMLQISMRSQNGVRDDAWQRRRLDRPSAQ